MTIAVAFHATRTGLQVQETLLATKATNIASQAVDGYKKRYCVAYDLPYQDHGNVGATTSDAGTVSPTGIQLGSGVLIAATYSVFTPGDRIQTDNPFDVMIEGDGFIEVLLPDGTIAYTRVGALQKDASGRLVMPKTGYPISPSITIPALAKKVSISPSGQVSVELPGDTASSVIGQIQLATFVNPSGLRLLGDSMYVETPASGTPTTGNPGTDLRGTLLQGYREGSNVNAVEEITDLIKIEKIYEMLTKVLKTGDAMMEAINRIRN